VHNENMAALIDEGIILRKYLLRETSYILKIFTKEHGKIQGVLKGARNPYPQFAGNFELFAHCDLLFYRKKRKTLDLITGCELRDFFFFVRKDIERLTYANYFIELIDVVTAENDPNGDLYTILLESLRLLSGESSPKRICRIFELKLLKCIGMAPAVSACLKCGSGDKKVFYFSIKDGGTICGDCAAGMRGRMRISMGTIKFMEKIYRLPFDRVHQIKVSREVGRETENILNSFIGFHLGRRIRSLEFLGQLEKEGILQK